VGHVVAERPIDEAENDDYGQRLKDEKPGVVHLEALRLNEGDHEVNEHPDTDRQTQKGEEDHSFSTAFAISAMSPNRAIAATT
jgi:hypothetical protein